MQRPPQRLIAQALQWRRPHDLAGLAVRPDRPHRRDRRRGRLPEPLLPQDLARRRDHPHRLRRPEDRAVGRLPRAAVPAQGRRDQHAHDAHRGGASRPEVADHRRPDAGRRRARVLSARAADDRRRRDRGAGDRLEVAEPGRREEPARRPLHRRDPGDRRQPDDGLAARPARRVRPHDPRVGAREPRAQRPAARIGLADADGPGRVRIARRQQRVQRGRPAQARRDHRDQQEEARRDRGRRRRLGAADPARGDQAAADACRARKRKRRSRSASRSRS